MHLLYTIICGCTTLYNTSVILTPYKTPPYTSRTCIRVYNNIIVGIFYYVLSTMGDTPQYTGSVLLDTVCTRFFCITEALWSEVTFWEYGKVIVVLCRCGIRYCNYYAHYPFRTLPTMCITYSVHYRAPPRQGRPKLSEYSGNPGKLSDNSELSQIQVIF